MKEGWMKNDEWWRFDGFCKQTNGQKNGQTDICDCRVAFATEKK